MHIQHIEDFCNKVAKLKVAVIGETIIDEFITVHYEGQSMKSFCPVFRLSNNDEKQIQQGGTLAIANHIRNFAKQVDFISNTKNEIVKTRLVDADGKKKHVEINKFDTSGFSKIDIDTRDYDLVIVADFGHGFCDHLNINDGFHLMCQTNSNNFGFNRLSKWREKRKKAICVDLREASLQVNKRIGHCTDADAKEIFNYELNSELLFVTLGAKGSLLTDGNRVVRHDSFKSTIVDTIGAGDTYFSFASLCSTVYPDLKDVLTIPSLAAALSTTWLCNEQSVTPDKLLNFAASFNK